MALFVTDFGTAEAPTAEMARKMAYEAWERMHWRMGGWGDLSEYEFERRLAAGTLLEEAERDARSAN